MYIPMGTIKTNPLTPEQEKKADLMDIIFKNPRSQEAELARQQLKKMKEAEQD